MYDLTWYVKAGGTGSGYTLEAPLPSIQAALAKIKKAYADHYASWPDAPPTTIVISGEIDLGSVEIKVGAGYPPLLFKGGSGPENDKVRNGSLNEDTATVTVDEESLTWIIYDRSFSGLTADGSPTVTTTTLTLIFDQDITGLTESDITIGARSTGTAKGTLTKTGTGTYELGVSGITAGGSIKVTPAKPGYAIDPASQEVTVYLNPGDTVVSFKGLSADGSAATTTTTKLILGFDPDIAGLTAGDITINARGTGTTKGNLISKGFGTYELEVSGIRAEGTIAVTPAKSGYSISPASQEVPVHYINPVAFNNLTVNDGSPTETTTKLILQFDKDIKGLTAADITIGGSTGASKGGLVKRTGTIGIYELEVSGINAGGDITVTPTKTGYAIDPPSRNVPVHYINPVTFSDLTVNGSSTATTTKLTLTFNKDITGLTEDDIAIDAGNTGAIRGTLTKKETGVYELGVSGIKAVGNIFVVPGKAGYDINPFYKTVTVNYIVPLAGMLKRDMVPVAPVTIEGKSDYNSKVFNASRTVILSAFKIAKYETTYELWYAVRQWAIADARGSSKYTFGNDGKEGDDGTAGAAPTGDKYEPVTEVSWQDVIVWCNAYSEMMGKEPVYSYNDDIIRDSRYTNATACDEAVMDMIKSGYRLPTVAEWEYAARGGGTPSTSVPFTYIYAGSDNPDAVAVYNTSGTATVGSKQANSLGLYDMSGNVFEWCWDWDEETISTGLESNPAGPSTGMYRIQRSGGWRDSGTNYCQIDQNGGAPTAASYDYVGFRVVSSP
jgi:formylglycine-generating enzyme required for sulfatase activity